MPRELLVNDDVVQLAGILSQQRIEDLNIGAVSIALEDAMRQSGGNISDSALDAFNEARDVVLRHSYNEISTHVANKRLESCAEKILANRGTVGSIISDVRSTMKPLVAGVAGVATTGALTWSWYTFTGALAGIQTLMTTPAGAITAVNIASEMKKLLPEGFTVADYAKFIIKNIGNRNVVESFVPTMAELQQKFDATKTVSSGIFGSLLNAGSNIMQGVNTILGGTPEVQAAILHEDIRHAHAQTVNYAKQVSGAIQTTQNIFGGWIAVLVIIFIVCAFMRLYRGFSRSNRREEFNRNATEFLLLRRGNNRRNVIRGDRDEQGQIGYQGFQFKSKKSAKKSKKSPTKSAKKAKKSPKKSVKKAKRSVKK